MLKVLLVTFVLIVIAIGTLFAFSPTRYEVVRERQLAATSSAIHPWIEDLRRWPEWTVWNQDHDPSLDYTYSGAERGVDARSSWTSKQGPGTVVITASDPDKGVWYDLTWGEGEGAMRSKGVFQYQPTAGGTRVRWTGAGELEGFVPRMMGYGVDMLIGSAFERGLEGLERAVEGGAAPAGTAGTDTEQAP
jgi:hypothetical protein